MLRKKNFEDGTYTSYGYDPTAVTWKTFLEGTYGISSDEEYKNLVLSEDIIADYKGKMNPLEQYTKETVGEEVTYNFAADTTNPIWVAVNSGMQEAADKYFSITGVHVLVSLYDSVFAYASGETQVDPTVEGKWTADQVAGAKELLNKVAEYLKEEKGTYIEKLDKIMAAYKSAPTVAGTTLSTFTYGETKTIDLYSYKALGLTLIWQNLGSFANGSMVETFNDACKNIYDYTQKVDGNALSALTIDNPVSYENVDYSLKKEDVFASGIETKFGYHLFVETKVATRNNLETDEEKPARYIPTLEEIQKNVSGQTVSTNVKTAITTYYAGYQGELKGTYYFNIVLNNEIKNLVSDANLKTYIDNYNDYIFESSLKYVTKDFLN